MTENIKNKKVFYSILTLALIVIITGIGLGIRHYNKLKEPQDLFIPKKEDNDDIDIDINIKNKTII